jgi:uncharacterized protein
VFISASAIGIYGDRGEEILTETSSVDKDFLAEVCQAWEGEADQIGQLGCRVVKLRLGIVMGNDGGALQQMLSVFRWGIGGKLGNGQQWFSWIHIVDLVEMILWAMKNEKVFGVLNATAPAPVRNQELTSEIARVLRRPAFMRVPKIALKTALGEFAESLLASQRVVPELALAAGFRFQFPDFRSAVEDLVA